MFKAVFWTATKFGDLRAWFAVGYNTGTPLEKACIYPSWLLATGVFNMLFSLARLIIWANRQLGRLSAD